MDSTLLDQFKAFVDAMEVVDKDVPLSCIDEPPDALDKVLGIDPNAAHRITHRKAGLWDVNCQPGFSDFNKEIAEPGDLPDYPEGCCAIRSDDDFWVEAVLPYEFRFLTIQQIVGVLWPEIDDARFHADVSAKLPPGGRHLPPDKR